MLLDSVIGYEMFDSSVRVRRERISDEVFYVQTVTVRYTLFMPVLVPSCHVEGNKEKDTYLTLLQSNGGHKGILVIARSLAKQGLADKALLRVTVSRPRNPNVYKNQQRLPPPFFLSLCKYGCMAATPVMAHLLFKALDHRGRWTSKVWYACGRTFASEFYV